MINYFSKKSNILFITAVLACVTPLFAASKSKKKKSSSKIEVIQVEDEESYENLDGSVKLPSQRRTYFYKIEPEIIANVENGSPASIRTAISGMHKSTAEYDEKEKILINIASEIMKQVWPSEKIGWDIPETDYENPYMGALASVNQGVFDSSTGNEDFLATVLPCIVLLKSVSDKSIYDSCKQALENAAVMKSDSVLLNYLMAVLLEKQNDFTGAERFIKTAYENSKETEEIALAYVRILRANGNVQLALDVLGNIKSDPNDITILKQNAYLAFDSKDFQSAELYVAKVLQQNPNDLEFLLFRARILIERKDYIHAVSLLDMYARQENSSIDYLVLRAKVQLDWSKNTSAATETVEKALQLYPENPDALMFAARISSVTDGPVAGKYADELAAKVLEKDPENQDAMMYALKGLIQRENWSEAYGIGKKIISQPFIDTEIVERFVTICINLGKNSEAYDFAKKQLDLNPGDENIIQAYVLAYSKVGSRDVVMKYIENLMVSSSAKMKSYLYYRRSFLQLTEENALADLRSSLISNPRNSDSLFRLYEIYFSKKDYRKAQYYLRQVVAINPNDNSVKQLNEALTKLMQ